MAQETCVAKAIGKDSNRLLALQRRASYKNARGTRAKPERSRALALLAERPDGYTRAIMLSRVFSLALTANLIYAGLATDENSRPYATGWRSCPQGSRRLSLRSRTVVNATLRIHETRRARYVSLAAMLSCTQRLPRIANGEKPT